MRDEKSDSIRDCVHLAQPASRAGTGWDVQHPALVESGFAELFPLLLAFVTIGGPSGSTTYVCRGGTVTLVFLGERLAWPLSRYDKVITAG